MSDVVVVGHGKTPLGRGWGVWIDKHLVIRMWNWAWQEAFDYGVRYDVGFFEISATEMARFNKHNRYHPKLGWCATELHSNVGHKKYEGALPAGTDVFSTDAMEGLGRRLGGVGVKGRLVLTRGCRAAGWALQRGGMTRGSRLILVGFDNAYTGRALTAEEGFPASYINSPAAFPMWRYDGDGVATKSGNHDFAVEGPLLRAIGEQYGIEVVHAQDIW